MSRFPTWFLRLSITLLVVLAAAAHPGAAQVPNVPNPLNDVPQKTYQIRRGTADSVRARLLTLMPEELKRVTIFTVNEQANTLSVQGPLAALEMADQCVPRAQMFVPGTMAGTFSPMNQITLASAQAPPQPLAPPKQNAPFLSGRAYRCAVPNAQAFNQELKKIFGNDPTIIFDLDVSQANQPQAQRQEVHVSFLAPENVQPQIAKTLYDMGVLLSDRVREDEDIISLDHVTSDSMVAYTTDPQPNGADSIPIKTIYVPKKRPIAYMDQTLRAAFLERRLVRINPIPDESSGPKNPIASARKNGETAENASAPQQSTGIAIYEYRVEKEQQRPRKVRLELDFDRKTVQIEGDKWVGEQMRVLIETIDRPSPGEGLDRKIITIRGKQAEHIRKFAAALALRPGPLNSWKQSTSTLQPVRQVVWKPQQEQIGGIGGIGGVESVPQLPPQQLGTGQPGAGQPGAGQPGVGQPGGGQFIQPPPQFGQEQFGQGPNGPGFDIPQSLQIRVLPALDIILFEGTNADSKRLKQMIADIELMMEQSKAEMKIVKLKHTDCISMNEMLFDMNYLMLFMQKQGRVNLFPLRNPNALMVVGWGTAFEEMLELIKTLDKPISQPGSTWKVIRLKYVSATYASTLITNLFPAVPNVSAIGTQHQFGYGWMPRVRAIADVRTNSLIVNAGPNDIKEVEALMHKIDLYESGPEMRVEKFPLKNSLATDVAAMLTNILTPGTAGIGVAADQKFPQFVIEKLGETEKRLIKSGIVSDFKINADVQHNAIIITAPEYAIPLIAELIELIDSPMPVAQIRMIPLYNGDAEQVMDILTRIIIPQQLQGQMVSRLPGAKGETNFVPLRFTNDVRSNTIIAVGSEKDLDIVEAFVWQLDKEDAEKRVKKVYTLKNAQAEDVANAIRLYITQQQNFYRSAPGVKSPFLQIEESLIVVPEKATNSLLIEATPKYFDEILEIIEDFDRQPDQVVIQVLIAEITCSNADEFGAEFGIQDSILFNRSSFDQSFQNTKTTTVTNANGTTESKTTVYTPAGNGTPGFAFGNPSTPLGNNLNELSAGTIDTVAPQLLTNFNMQRVGTETGFGGMVFSASSDSVNILIRALQERKRLEVLSRPQITAMDNQMAFILVGQRVPRVAGTTMSSGVSQGSVEMEEVGLMLMVTPRISPDGKVVMNIGAEKSSLGSVADGVPIPSGSGSVNSPKISAITTMTNVCASDNETVLLGGLLTKDTENIDRRVPYLADIPVLGRLFQYRLEMIKKTELMIILTPRIITHTKPGEKSKDAALIKREEAARIHWCLNDVLKLHASSSGDIGIYDSTADEPVSGKSRPIYPKTPFNRNDLELMVPEHQNRANVVDPLQDSSFDPDLIPTLPDSATESSQPVRLNSNTKNAPTPGPSLFRRSK